MIGPACPRAADGARAERWKFFTLTIACHEGHRPPMTSSPIVSPARSRYLLDLLAQVPDPRKKRGRQNQLGLERHGGRVPAGLWARVLQRLLALNACIWHNWQIGAPVKRSLIAYDHV